MGVDARLALPDRGSRRLRAALEASPRQPKATPPEIEDRIIEPRKELLDIGTDAGADTIHTHLECEGLIAPLISTIQPILARRGFVTPAPKKRPKSSYVCFVADLPNECPRTSR